MKFLKVGIAGYGVVGKRRHDVITQHPNLKVTGICDQIFQKQSVDNHGINYYSNYHDLLNKESLDILFISFPNYLASEATIMGLSKGLHVFCEKPPGRNVYDIEEVIKVEKKNQNLKLKYGFNHRYHDSVILALQMIASKKYGEVINIRGVYGKSRIIPFSGGWRASREIAGGGILLDQGIHMIDLISLFMDEIIDIKSFVGNDYWKHDVEDNAYALLQDKKGRVAMMHSSATQWQHRFSLDIALTNGYIELHGILSGSKSYGEEKIIFGSRDEESLNGQMENTSIKFLADNSWHDEVFEFIDAIIKDKPIVSGNSLDALRSMRIVYNIYYNDEQWRNKFKIEKPY